MCRYFSCIITNDFKAHWLKNSVEHESILASIPIEDLRDQDKLRQRKFVKIEIRPCACCGKPVIYDDETQTISCACATIKLAVKPLDLNTNFKVLAVKVKS